MTYGYNARRFHHVIFMCRNNGIREPFYLTVQEMRAWHDEFEGKRLRRFMANGGNVKALHPTKGGAA
jgi:hypothetical protein